MASCMRYDPDGNVFEAAGMNPAALDYRQTTPAQNVFAVITLLCDFRNPEAGANMIHQLPLLGRP